MIVKSIQLFMGNKYFIKIIHISDTNIFIFFNMFFAWHNKSISHCCKYVSLNTLPFWTTAGSSCILRVQWASILLFSRTTLSFSLWRASSVSCRSFSSLASSVSTSSIASSAPRYGICGSTTSTAEFEKERSHYLGHIYKRPQEKKLKLMDNFGTELQQNQRMLQILKIMVGCRSNSV